MQEIESLKEDIILSGTQTDLLKELIDFNWSKLWGDYINEQLNFKERYINFLNSLGLLKCRKNKKDWIANKLKMADESKNRRGDIFNYILIECNREWTVNELKNKKGENVDNILELIAINDPPQLVSSDAWKMAIRVFGEREDGKSISSLIYILRRRESKSFLVNILKERVRKQTEFREEILKVFIQTAMFNNTDESWVNPEIVNFIVEIKGEDGIRTLLGILENTWSCYSVEAVFMILAKKMKSRRTNRILEDFLHDIKKGVLEKRGTHGRNLKKILKKILEYRRKTEKLNRRLSWWIAGR